MKRKYKIKILKIINILAYSASMILISLYAPMFFRFFYDKQINSLKIPENTGHTYEEVREAYYKIILYIDSFFEKTFEAGVFKYTFEAKNQFYSLKIKFFICVIIFIILICFLIIMLGCKEDRYEWGDEAFGEAFYGSVVSSSLVAIFWIFVSIDTKKTFNFLYKVIFLGSKGYTFDPANDEIIKLFPLGYFINFAIFSSIIIGVISFSIILISIVKKIILIKKKKIIDRIKNSKQVEDEYSYDGVF